MVRYFISYSRQDQEIVDQLVAKLNQAGIEVWIDKQGLIPGTSDWEQALRDAIQDSDAVLLVASPNSRSSTYVKDEIAIASASNKTIIPLWVAGKRWNDSIALGYGTIQNIDMRGNKFDEGIQQLASLLGSSKSNELEIEKANVAMLSSNINKIAIFLVAVVAIVALAILLFLPDGDTLASTPEPSETAQAQDDTTVTSTSEPTLTSVATQENETDEPVTDTPTSEELSTDCSIDGLITNDGATLTLFIDENSLVIHLGSDQESVNISQLGFEYSDDGTRTLICLKDLFPTLDLTPLEPTNCLVIARDDPDDDTDLILPQACDEILANFPVSDEEVFWYDRNQQQAFMVLHENALIDFCGTARSRTCDISLASPPQLTPATVVDINLTWGSDYLAIYTTDNVGLINLDGLRITSNPNEESRGRLLQEQTVFDGLAFDRIPSPVCFIFARDDNFVPPQGCQTDRMIVQNVSTDSDMFWRDNNRNLSLFILVNDEQVGVVCGNSDACTRSVMQTNSGE
ncbi:MAG: toll/interleukin-1 receptor domain-containing protein [Chloroflexota bacterium]